MLKRNLFLLLIVWCYSAIGFTASKTGFDEICHIYAEAKNSGMIGEQLGKYIFDNVNARVSVEDALQAHEAVFHLNPDERYSIFKQSAELSLKRSWDCQAVKDLMK